MSFGKIVGYYVDGVAVCAECADLEDSKNGEPIYLTDAMEEEIECDECGDLLEELSY